MSSTNSLTPSGVYACKCGHTGEADTFISEFEAATDTNWLRCPKCNTVVRLTKIEECVIDYDTSTLEANSYFWDNKKATLGPISYWDLVAMIKQSIPIEDKIAHMANKKLQHTYTQTLKAIVKPLSKDKSRRLLNAMGVDKAKYLKVKDIKWTYLHWAIKFAQTQDIRNKAIHEWTIPKVRHADIITSAHTKMSTTAAPIVMADYPANHTGYEREFIKNPKFNPKLPVKGWNQKWFVMAKLEAWFDKLGLDVDHGCQPRSPEYDETKVTAKLVGFAKMKVLSELGELEDDDTADAIDLALRDIAYGEWTRNTSKVYREFESKLQSEYEIGFDDTDTDESCDVPDEEPYNFNLAGLQEWAAMYHAA